MPKPNPPGNIAKTVASNQKLLTEDDMEQVKIKRIKRNKKPVTTQEKILAGLGVAGTIMGGASMAAPKAQAQNIVSSQTIEQSTATSKVKAILNKIFGVVESNTFGIPKVKADYGDGQPTSGGDGVNVMAEMTGEFNSMAGDANASAAVTGSNTGLAQTTTSVGGFTDTTSNSTITTNAPTAPTSSFDTYGNTAEGQTTYTQGVPPATASQPSTTLNYGTTSTPIPVTTQTDENNNVTAVNLNYTAPTDITATPAPITTDNTATNITPENIAPTTDNTQPQNPSGGMPGPSTIISPDLTATLATATTLAAPVVGLDITSPAPDTTVVTSDFPASDADQSSPTQATNLTIYPTPIQATVNGIQQTMTVYLGNDGNYYNTTDPTSGYYTPSQLEINSTPATQTPVVPSDFPASDASTNPNGAPAASPAPVAPTNPAEWTVMGKMPDGTTVYADGNGGLQANNPADPGSIIPVVQSNGTYVQANAFGANATPVVSPAQASTPTAAPAANPLQTITTPATPANLIESTEFPGYYENSNGTYVDANGQIFDDSKGVLQPTGNYLPGYDPTSAVTANGTAAPATNIQYVGNIVGTASPNGVVTNIDGSSYSIGNITVNLPPGTTDPNPTSTAVNATFDANLLLQPGNTVNGAAAVVVRTENQIVEGNGGTISQDPNSGGNLAIYAGQNLYVPAVVFNQNGYGPATEQISTANGGSVPGFTYSVTTDNQLVANNGLPGAPDQSVAPGAAATLLGEMRDNGITQIDGTSLSDIAAAYGITANVSSGGTGALATSFVPMGPAAPSNMANTVDPNATIATSNNYTDPNGTVISWNGNTGVGSDGNTYSFDPSSGNVTVVTPQTPAQNTGTLYTQYSTSSGGTMTISPSGVPGQYNVSVYSPGATIPFSTFTATDNNIQTSIGSDTPTATATVISTALPTSPAASDATPAPVAATPSANLNIINNQANNQNPIPSNNTAPAPAAAVPDLSNFQGTIDPNLGSFLSPTTPTTNNQTPIDLTNLPVNSNLANLAVMSPALPADNTASITYTQITNSVQNSNLYNGVDSNGNIAVYTKNADGNFSQVTLTQQNDPTFGTTYSGLNSDGSFAGIFTKNTDGTYSQETIASFEGGVTKLQNTATLTPAPMTLNLPDLTTSVNFSTPAPPSGGSKAVKTVKTTASNVGQTAASLLKKSIDANGTLNVNTLKGHANAGSAGMGFLRLMVPVLGASPSANQSVLNSITSWAENQNYSTASMTFTNPTNQQSVTLSWTQVVTDLFGPNYSVTKPALINQIFGNTTPANTPK